MTRILFITATRIGDAILSSGVLDHVVRTYPDAAITVACGPLAAPLFRATPCVDTVIVMKKQKMGGHWLSLWRQVAMQGWDHVIDLRGSLTSWFLWAGKRHVKRTKPGQAARHRVLEAASVLNLDPPPDTTVWIDQAGRDRALAELPDGQQILALSPSASAVFKEWPPERFAQFAHQITDETAPMEGAAIAVFGGPGDEATSQAVLSKISDRHVIDLTGKLDLIEAAACLSRARLFVGNDSGLMHMAAAAGTPTLGLFGPTDDRLYAPWGAKADIVRAGARFNERERAALAASQSQSLMGALDVQDVYSGAMDLLKRTEA